MRETYHCSASGQEWSEPFADPASALSGDRLCPFCGATFVGDVAPPDGSGSDHDDVFSGITRELPCAHRSDIMPTVKGYEIQGELGRGGMGVVYRAYAHELGRTVALKALAKLDPNSLHRFKKEFRILADVSHPNLVSLYELVSHGDAWFFSMQFVDGVDLLTYVQNGPLGQTPSADDDLQTAKFRRLRRGLTQLCRAVAALHQQRILHRDIKPSNIRVDRHERLFLLDFGLAADIAETDITDDCVAGTIPYMAPEQASGERTPASDWYAVGIVLYQALTGRLPFRGSPMDVLLDKQLVDPPAPKDVVPGVPEDLDRLCMDLLNRNPALRPSATEVQERIGILDLEDQADAAASQIELVGRDAHMAFLRDAYEVMVRGGAVSILVRGRSGMGKTSLVEHFLTELSGCEQTVVLRGRCYERESVPFKALDSLVDSLAHYLRTLPKGEAEGIMPRDIQALMRVFPVLGRVEAAYRSSRRMMHFRDQQELRRRAAGALRELLARLGDRYPLVLHVDDLQWGDLDSMGLLLDLLAPPDPPALMFVGSYRSEDEDSSTFLLALHAAASNPASGWKPRQLNVGSLEDGDCRQLAKLLLGRTDWAAEELANTVAHESGGNPFLVRELVMYLQSDTQEIDSTNIDLDSVLWSRVRRLPAAAMRLLQIIAVAGRPTRYERVLTCAAIPDEASPLLNRLRNDRLMRVIGAGTESYLETYHDRVREAVLNNLSAKEQARTHLELATTICNSLKFDASELKHVTTSAESLDNWADDREADAAVWQDIFDAAYHFDAAGECAKALPFALLAAERARKQHSLDAANQQYTIALHSREAASGEVRHRMILGMSEVLMLQGSYREASELLHAEVERAQSGKDEAELVGRLGELAFKRGDMASAGDAFEKALRLIGRRVPRSTPAVVAMLSWELLLQCLHTLFPRLFLERRRLQGAELDFMAIRLYSRFTYMPWFARGNLPSLWAHLREMNLAERYPPTLELAQAYSEHAPAMSLVPSAARGVRYAERSLEIRREMGDLWGQGQTLHFYGLLLHAVCQYRACIKVCRQAIELLERTGDPWEVNIARHQIGSSLYRLGDLQAAVAEARRIQASAERLGDAQAAGFCLDIWSRASNGRLPAEVVQRELERPTADVQIQAQLGLAEAVRLLRQDQAAAALAILQEKYQLVTKAHMKNLVVVALQPWIATAQRRLAEQHGGRDTASGRLGLRRARRAARRALRTGKRFKTELPHALRECGLIAAGQGRLGKARAYFERSVLEAERQHARYELAQTKLAIAQLDALMGNAGANAAVRKAKQLVRMMENVGEWEPSS